MESTVPDRESIGRRHLLLTVKKKWCLDFATDGMTSDEMFLSRPIGIFLFYQKYSRDEPNLA